MDLDIIDIQIGLTSSSYQEKSLRQKLTEETTTGLAVEIWAVIFLENAPYHINISSFYTFETITPS
jgi:hypothetical protein